MDVRSMWTCGYKYYDTEEKAKKACKVHNFVKQHHTRSNQPDKMWKCHLNSTFSKDKKGEVKACEVAHFDCPVYNDDGPLLLSECIKTDINQPQTNTSKKRKRSHNNGNAYTHTYNTRSHKSQKK